MGGDTVVNNADRSKVLVEHACLGNVRYNSITTTVYQGTDTTSMWHTLVYVPINSAKHHMFQCSRFLTEIFLDYALIKKHSSGSPHLCCVITLPCEKEQQNYG